MVVTSSQLPAIPPSERHLLLATLELDADLPAVAARTRTPLDDLTRWVSSEAVQAWLAAHTRLTTYAREHRELRRLTRNLDDLEQLANTTTDPIEKRRLLTAILRGSTAILRGCTSAVRSAGGRVRSTPDREHRHSRSQPSETLPEVADAPWRGGVGSQSRRGDVGSFDTPTQPTVAVTLDPKQPGTIAAPRPSSQPTTPAGPIAPSPNPSAAKAGCHVGQHADTHPAATQAPSARQLLGFTPLHAPITPFAPTCAFLPTSDIRHPTSNIPRPRSPASLLATAGLPGP